MNTPTSERAAASDRTWVRNHRASGLLSRARITAWTIIPILGCLSGSYLSGSLAAQDLPASIEKLIPGLIEMKGIGLRPGTDPELGDYVVTVVRVKGSFDSAQFRARANIAKFFGDMVDTRSELKTERITKDGKTTFSKSFGRVTKTRAEQLLAGVSVQSVRQHKGQPYAVFLLCEKDARRAVNLKKEILTAKGAQRQVVIAIGMAPMKGQNPRELALGAAMREAVSMVAGQVVVATSMLKDNSELHETILGHTDALVESHEVLDSGPQGDFYIVKIKAEVNASGVYEEFSAFLGAIGNPFFYVNVMSDDRIVARELQSKFEQLMKKWGFRLTAAQEKAQYWLNVDPSFTELKHVISKRSGTKLRLGVELSYVDNGEVSSPVSGDGRITSFLSDPDTRRSVCIRKAIDQIEDELQKSLGKTVMQLAKDGRPVDVSIRARGGAISSLAQEQIEAAIRELPGVRSCIRKFESETLILKLRLCGRLSFFQSCIVDAVAQKITLDEFQVDRLHFKELKGGHITYTYSPFSPREK